MLDNLIAATYSRDREQYLRAANLGLEKMRFAMRLSKDLHYLNLKGYEYAARAINNVGCLVGGWMKSDRTGNCGTDVDNRSRSAAPS